jgi:hypothetical protein
MGTALTIGHQWHFLITDVQLIIKPLHPTLETTEQSLNNIIMLRHFVTTIKPIFDALDDARSGLLMKIRQARTFDNLVARILSDFLARYVPLPISILLP